MTKPFYISTAISYPNGPPHIGHAYEAIAADVIARFQRSRGRDVLFQTGTDEHGLKMAQAARDQGLEPQELATRMSDLFRAMADGLDVSYDQFIRTTEPAHHRASQAIWRAMEAQGDIYLGRYEGWYSLRDEAFYDEKELVDGEGGQRLSPQGSPVEWTAEESWFFRLSAYGERLLEHYRANPDFIAPDSRRNEVMSFVAGGLSDLSVSRTSFDWGVRVPGSDDHVMYVWVDALTNYLTGAGYPDDPDKLARFWPADVHLIGKDIVRFHAVYWPAFLMSAGLPLPKQVFGHGFVLHRGEKMSKSVGNVVAPEALAERFGTDQFRYFLMREVPFGGDGSWSEEAIVGRVNAELANGFGNLVQRTLTLVSRRGAWPAADALAEADEALLAEVAGALEVMTEQMEALALTAALESWMRAVFACNRYVDEQAPWALAKTDPARQGAVLATLLLAVRDMAVALAPFAPRAAGAGLDALGQDGAGRSHAAIGDRDWLSRLAESGSGPDKPTPLFPRLQLEDA